MTYTTKQIDKILKLRRDHKMGSDAIARKLKLSRNPVRDILRKYGLLPYSYPPNLGTGPPSPLDPSPWPELEKKDILLKNALEQIQTLERQVNDTNQKLNQKNDEYNKLKQEHATTIQERDDYKQQRSENEKELQEERRQKGELNRQINEDLPRLRQENENLTSKNTKFIETLKHDVEESQKKDNKIEELANSLKEVLKPPVTLHTADEETDNPGGGVDWGLLILGGIGSFVQGITGTYKPKTTNLQTAGSRKNTGHGIPQIMICSGISYSGSGFSYDGENTGNTFPNPGTVPQPDVQGMNSGVTPVINGILCSGFYSGMYGENSGAGYVVSNQDDVNQPDNHNSVTIDSNFLDLLGSKNYCSSHIEPLGFIPQEATRASSFQTPINYYYIPLPSPLPDDLSEVYHIRQLRNFGGIQFEKYIKKFLDYKGCPMELTPYRDKGVDLFGKMDGKNTIIQCKQKPKVEIGVIQRLYANKKRYKADRFLVITTGEFTKDAIEEAQNLGVVCWNGKQLLQEIYKYQFFYLPE